MFVNQAGSLTCSNKKCGRLIFSASAEEYRILLCAHSALLKVCEKSEELIRAQKGLIAAQEEKIKRLEKEAK
jgi:hypothetical protein